MSGRSRARLTRWLGGRRGAPRQARFAAGLLLVVLGWAHGAVAQAPDPGEASSGNPIVRENELPGDRDWYVAIVPRPEAVGIAPGESVETGDRPAGEVWAVDSIEGYADRTSVERGGTIGFHVSTDAPTFDLSVSRMGWYGGQGGRTLHRVEGLRGEAQPVPPPDPVTGLVAADWRLSYSLRIPEDWTSGVYLVRLRADSDPPDEAQVVFVVRNDQQTADFVYKLPVNTYQAYNNWGGKSLYEFNSEGPPALKVSFDRPYALRGGAGHFFHWDYSMIRWLEREGYNVTYISDVDAHADNDYLPGRRGLLSVGHDEYWSKEMRDSWDSARNGGHSLGFFSANTAYWQVRFEPSATGLPNRILVCYKQHAPDPLASTDPGRATVLWRNPPVSRPENALLGIMSEGMIPFDESYPFVVRDASHWIFAGTDAEPGQAWSRIVGYEYDRVMENGATPTGLVILAESPLIDTLGKPSVSHATYYRQGGMVFAAGTVDWPWGLDDYWRPGHVDPRLQRTTANILAAFRAGVPPIPDAPAVAAVPPGGAAPASSAAPPGPAASPAERAAADRSASSVYFGAAAISLAAACVPLWLLYRRARDERA
jgi:hypothetical protein